MYTINRSLWELERLELLTYWLVDDTLYQPWVTAVWRERKWGIFPLTVSIGVSNLNKCFSSKSTTHAHTEVVCLMVLIRHSGGKGRLSTVRYLTAISLYRSTEGDRDRRRGFKTWQQREHKTDTWLKSMTKTWREKKGWRDKGEMEEWEWGMHTDSR